MKKLKEMIKNNIGAFIAFYKHDIKGNKTLVTLYDDDAYSVHIHNALLENEQAFGFDYSKILDNDNYVIRSYIDPNNILNIDIDFFHADNALRKKLIMILSQYKSKKIYCDIKTGSYLYKNGFFTEDEKHFYDKIELIQFLKAIELV